MSKYIRILGIIMFVLAFYMMSQVPPELQGVNIVLVFMGLFMATNPTYILDSTSSNRSEGRKAVTFYLMLGACLAWMQFLGDTFSYNIKLYQCIDLPIERALSASDAHWMEGELVYLQVQLDLLAQDHTNQRSSRFMAFREELKPLIQQLADVGSPIYKPEKDKVVTSQVREKLSKLKAPTRELIDVRFFAFGFAWRMLLSIVAVYLLHTLRETSRSKKDRMTIE